VVGGVLVGVVDAVVDVGPFVAAVGGLLVAELVGVPNVVGPAVGICGEARRPRRVSRVVYANYIYELIMSATWIQ
jgi:hypothetical protein